MLENNKKIGDVITENDIKSYVKLDAKGNLPNPAKPEPRGERNAATGRVEIIVENMFVVWQRDTKCPNGGTYTIGRIGVNPVCSFHGDLLGTNSP